MSPSVFISRSPEETRANAAHFAAQVQAGANACLHGDLGAGKTEWVRGLLAALDSSDDVTSPTFSLVHEYHHGRRPVYHWDLYRLGAKTDWGQIDLLDHLEGPGLTVIEWPSRFPEAWPSNTWHISLKVLPDETREITWSQSPPSAAS